MGRRRRPAYLKQQVELSLRRLGVERIDLIQLHRIDPEVPVADQVGAFKELQDEGKVRHIGLSEIDVDQLQEAQRTAQIVSVQNHYNLANRPPRRCWTMPRRTASASSRGSRWRPPPGHGRRTARGDLEAGRRDTVAARPGLAAQALAGHAPDPGDVQRRATSRTTSARRASS